MDNPAAPKPIRILVVDDSAFNRQTITAFLQTFAPTLKDNDALIAQAAAQLTVSDDSRRLMPQNGRRSHVVIAVHEMQIAVAHAARHNADHDLML